MKNYEKLRFGAYPKINAFSMLFPGFFCAFCRVFRPPSNGSFARFHEKYEKSEASEGFARQVVHAGMPHSLLENWWFWVSTGRKGLGRAGLGGLGSKKGVTKRSYTPPLGEKNAGVYLSPKKRSFVSRDFEKIMINYKKLWKITKNYGFEHTPKSTLFLRFFYAFSRVFLCFFYAFSGVFPAPIKWKFFEISWKIREFWKNYDNL